VFILRNKNQPPLHLSVPMRAMYRGSILNDCAFGSDFRLRRQTIALVPSCYDVRDLYFVDDDDDDDGLI
jgi:hypothetical protein